MDNRSIDNINSGINFNYSLPIKRESGAELFNVTDSFSQGQTTADPAVDMRKAAEILLRQYSIDSLTKWSASIGPMVGSTPIQGPDGAMYVGSHDGKLYAFDGVTGKKKWDHDLQGGSVGVTPLLKDGVLYCPGDTGKLFALNAATGEELWSKDFNAQPKCVSSPVVGADGKLYFGYIEKPEKHYMTGKHYLVALDSANGDEKWRREAREGMGTPSVATGDDGTVYANLGDYSFCALDGTTGKEKWSKFLEAQGTSQPVVKDGVVYVGEKYGQRLYAFDAETGKPKWTHTLKKGHVGTSPAIGKDKVFIAPETDANKIIAIGIDDGKQKWECETGETRHSGVSLDKYGNLFVQGHRGNLYVVDSESGKRREKLELDNNRPGFEVKNLSTPTIGSNGMVFMGNRNGKVYGFEFPYAADAGDVPKTEKTGTTDIKKEETTVEIDGVILNKRNKAKHFSFIEGNDLF